MLLLCNKSTIRVDGVKKLYQKKPPLIESKRSGNANKAKEDVFAESYGTYGAYRIAGELRKRGLTARFNKVKRNMTSRNLFSMHLRFQMSLTDSRGARDEDCPNLLRDVVIKDPFQALSSDIICIRTNEGSICTAFCSGLALAERTASHMKKDLVPKTIRSTVKSWRLPRGAVFHLDLGSCDLMRKLGLRQSFSRSGKPGDNAWSESFFSILNARTDPSDW